MMVDDRELIAIAERSSTVMAIERAGAWLGRAAAGSTLLASARRAGHMAAPHAAVVVLSGVATHVLLMSVAPPASRYGWFLPALFAAAGLVLFMMRPPARRE